MTKGHKNELCKHIRDFTISENIQLLNINGHHEHMHVLLSILPEQNVSTLINLIKGESAFWANKNMKWTETFSWQFDFFAASISQSHMEKVHHFIDNQEKLHQKKTFEEEYNKFIKKNLFEMG